MYKKLGRQLASEGMRLRVDEMNSSWRGGSKGSSDTYASTLWSLDWDCWWASHGIAGLNYHTGGSVLPSGEIRGPAYSSFVINPDDKSFVIKPISYAHLAFSQAVLEQAAPVTLARLDQRMLRPTLFVLNMPAVG